MSDPATVLDFWLGELQPAQWYAVDPALDDEIRDQFADLWEAAAAGGLDHWIDGAAGTLAYIVLTDQFPRNMWRGSGRAFATDARALDAARRAVAENWDMHAPEPERQFFYLPYMHSENPDDQAACIALFAARMPETGAANHLHARAHALVIERFGRFPYRNAALGRPTTAAEQAFLDAGGYRAALEEVQG